MADLGLLLKREREARNISLDEIASSTKIGLRYLEALEADRFDFMPGDFFIKGIIRTYARYLGLDEQDVLSRYRAAGVFGEATPSRHKQGPAPKPQPLFPPSPPSPASPAEAPPPSPLFEPATAPDARKRLLYWLAGAGIIILLLALILLLWTALRPKPAPEKAVAASPLIDQPSSPAAATPQEPEPQPPPSQEWPGLTMEISFEAETWMQVYADGLLKIDGLFPPGAKAKARADTELLIHVGNAGGFSFLLNGRPAKPLGRSGAVIKDIRITADNFKDFLQAPAPEPPAD